MSAAAVGPKKVSGDVAAIVVVLQKLLVYEDVCTCIDCIGRWTWVVGCGFVLFLWWCVGVC